MPWSQNRSETTTPAISENQLAFSAPATPSWTARSVRWNSVVWNLEGGEASRIARDVNVLQARAAFGWVAAHPDGPHLAQIPWPKPAPAVAIYDDQSLPAAVVNARPHARPHRFSR